MEKAGKKMCRRKATTEKLPVAPSLLQEAKLNRIELVNLLAFSL